MVLHIWGFVTVEARENNYDNLDKIVADVSKEEEEISKFRLTIAMGDNAGKPRITAMQKGKAGTINTEDMETILKLAESKWTEMFPKVKEHVFG